MMCSSVLTCVLIHGSSACCSVMDYFLVFVCRQNLYKATACLYLSFPTASPPLCGKIKAKKDLDFCFNGPQSQLKVATSHFAQLM